MPALFSIAHNLICLVWNLIGCLQLYVIQHKMINPSSVYPLVIENCVIIQSGFPLFLLIFL
ncbi:hypothetical protein SLEP1_g55678 [Rubroshorea leprosula]|uniref:Uncharacterized protein n=1 Tax=Rubroshorea leprosula TaxID=152421 RepID=A0AAV5MG18_9ROSI|nr:hypothetical protein SLEP1_g55678 [Rubroshorea leprosula]